MRPDDSRIESMRGANAILEQELAAATTRVAELERELAELKAGGLTSESP